MLRNTKPTFRQMSQNSADFKKNQTKRSNLHTLHKISKNVIVVSTACQMVLINEEIMQKPKVLILGGCGFVGRNLTTYLVQEDLASLIRVVDKVPPQIAWLNKNHFEAFKNGVVEFRSANLINKESCKNAFAIENCCWDFVINCAGEIRFSQMDQVYEEGIFKLSLNCANMAALNNVKHYIELSSANMFSCGKGPHKEDGPLEPWTHVAKWKSKVEHELLQIPTLKTTILRLPLVYGSGDRTGLLPRIMIASIYKKLGETMKLLWSSDLKINTVHVEDVCRAIWFVLNREDTAGQIYNISDEASSTQGTISEVISELFNIQIDYYGTLVCSMLDMVTVADEGNDKHLKPWAEACERDGVLNTPLSPHMDPEALVKKHLHVDNAKIKGLGFDFKYPRPSVDVLRRLVGEYVEMNVFPVSLAP